MFTVERQVGRLVEARVRELKNRQAADAYFQAITAAVVDAPSPHRAVICADHRPVVIYPPVVADRLVELFTSVNKRVERAALIVARSNATVSLQIERIVRESDNANRRVFYDVEPAQAFLSEVLSAAEKARVRRFLLPAR
jgi:hypothetical protein